jgi:hypothetical protein
MFWVSDLALRVAQPRSVKGVRMAGLPELRRGGEALYRALGRAALPDGVVCSRRGRRAPWPGKARPQVRSAQVPPAGVGHGGNRV